MAIASLGGMSPAPTQLTIGRPRSGIGGGMGGGSAQDGLGQINTGAQTVGSAINQAATALGTGGGMAQNPFTSGGVDLSPMMDSFKNGGKVKSKTKDWHGFGKGGSTGNNKHGF
jgi:hypothetical protein